MVKQNAIMKREHRIDMETLMKPNEISTHHILNIDHKIQAKRIENQARYKQLNIIKELVRLLFFLKLSPSVVYTSLKTPYIF